MAPVILPGMLIGEHTHNLDPKKRLSIPAKFRKELGDGAVLTRGLDGCLWLFPSVQWAVLAQRISNLPMAQSDSRSFARLLLSGATEVQFDSLGRILVPDYLKQYASLAREVVITGVHTRLELWDKGAWNQYKTKLEKNGDAIAQKLGDLGTI
ncbi:MAG: division/cell wall cluster transcriptional repressor MraZ [Patescibacteria group bacterium]